MKELTNFKTYEVKHFEHQEKVFGITINSLGTIDKGAIKEIKDYNKTYESIGVDYDHFLKTPQLVKVHSIFDPYVESILGSEAYKELIPRIGSQMEIHQCHYNSGIAGDEIDCYSNGDIVVYFCGGFFGENTVYNSTFQAHCILYIEKDGKGAFIDPTQLVLNDYRDTFQLFYFSPILSVICDLFDEEEQAYNPIFGYAKWDLYEDEDEEEECQITA